MRDTDIIEEYLLNIALGQFRTHELLLKVLHYQHQEKEQVQAMALDTSALVAEITNQTTVIGGVVTLLQNLSADLANEPAAQAAINDAVTKLQSNDTALADAITANTPAAPTTGDTGGTPTPTDGGNNPAPGDGTPVV